MEAQSETIFENEGIAGHFSKDFIPSNVYVFPIGKSLDKSHMYRKRELTVLPTELIIAHMKLAIMLSKIAQPSEELGVTETHIAACSGEFEHVKMVMNLPGESVNSRTTEDAFTPSHYAVACNNLPAISALIQGKADVNICGVAGYSAVISACERGLLDALRLLLSGGGKVGTKSKEGGSLLHHAAISGNAEMLELLLAKGLKVDHLNINDVSPLAVAIEKGHLEAVQLLLIKGAKVDIPFTSYDSINDTIHHKTTVMHLAAQKGDLEIFKLLLERGAVMDSRTDTGLLPLHLAAYFGRLNIVKEMLEYGIDVNSTDNELFTPLHYTVAYASIANTEEVVKLLIEHGANVNACTKGKSTPLHIAAVFGSLSVVKLMVEQHNADLHLLNVEKEGLVYCALASRNDEVLEYVLKAGVDPNVADARNYTPLHHAAIFYSKASSVRLLLEYGATIPADAERQWSALHCAARCGAYDMAKVLIEKGADVAALSSNGSQPLHLAVTQCLPNIVELLCENGADANALDPHGLPPLHLAAHRSSAELVKPLLDHNAAVDATISYGITALHIAVRFDNLKIVKLLTDRGADVNRVVQGDLACVHLSARYSGKEVLDFLLMKGAYFDAECKNPQNELPVVWNIVRLNPKEKVLEYVALQYNLRESVMRNDVPSASDFLKNGALVNLHTKEMGTPIIEATKKGYLEMAKILLDNRADLNFISSNGSRAIHYAVENNNFEMVILLLQNKSPFEPLNGNGLTPLELAENVKDKQIAKVLKFASTYFREVVKGRTKKVLAMLSELADNFPEQFKALLSATNNEGKTIPVLALTLKNRELAAALLDRLKNLRV